MVQRAARRVQGYWADFKAPDFQDLPSDTVAVVPIGAIEQHGPHLPVSVDRDLVEAVVSRALQRLTPEQNVLVLPTLAIAKSDEHVVHPGTLSISGTTLRATILDIGASIARAGIERLFLLNGHGGNTAILESVVRDLRKDHNLISAHGSWFGFADDMSVYKGISMEADIHAGDIETSAMLAAKPELVDMDQAGNFTCALQEWSNDFRFIGLAGQAARPGWLIDDLTTSGACGDASAATSEKGRVLLESAAQNFALFLAEFARFDHRRNV